MRMISGPEVRSDDPEISIIVPFRNATATLAATLDCLVAQSFQSWEGVLVDDASDDDGPTLAAERVTVDSRFRLIRLENRVGPACARNIGIRASRGRWIAFLDADDVWLPQKLAMQIPVLRAGAPLVFSSYVRTDTEGHILQMVEARAHVCYNDLLGGNLIGCLTAVWDSERFGRAQMPDLPMHEDYAFWLYLLRSGGSAVGLPQILAQYRVGPDSHSACKWLAARATWSILRAEPDLGLLRATIGFCKYSIRAARRRV